MGWGGQHDQLGLHDTPWRVSNPRVRVYRAKPKPGTRDFYLTTAAELEALATALRRLAR